MPVCKYLGIRTLVMTGQKNNLFIFRDCLTEKECVCKSQGVFTEHAICTKKENIEEREIRAHRKD